MRYSFAVIPVYAGILKNMVIKNYAVDEKFIALRFPIKLGMTKKQHWCFD